MAGGGEPAKGESIVGVAAGSNFSADKLNGIGGHVELCCRAARKLGLEVGGGEMNRTADGSGEGICQSFISMIAPSS